jgi:hypothetical protein
MPKLFLYKAKDENVVAILRRGEYKRREWQLIKWDIDTDTFQMGQWLTKKMVFPMYSSISPDGKYFSYVYDYDEAVLSKLPNFTAEYYSGNSSFMWYDFNFSRDGRAIEKYQNQYLKRNQHTELELVYHKEVDRSEWLPSGYIGARNPRNNHRSDTVFRNVNGENIVDDMKQEESNSISCSTSFDDYYEKHATFVDSKGRTITIKKGILYADGEVLLDTTDHKFEQVLPI